MIKNREIQGPIDASLEAKMREMKIEDTVEVTVSLEKPFNDSLQLLCLYLSEIGVSGYSPLPTFELVVDLHLTRREVIDIAEQEYVKNIGMVLEEYR